MGILDKIAGPEFQPEATTWWPKILQWSFGLGLNFAQDCGIIVIRRALCKADSGLGDIARGGEARSTLISTVQQSGDEAQRNSNAESDADRLPRIMFDIAA